MIPEKSFIFAETPLLSIGSAAQLLGVSVNLLRLYEAEGLILPSRTSKNQRRYSREDLARISCIRYAIRSESMTIPAIRKMMALVPCWDILGCSRTDRANCEAFHGNKHGCWNYHHKNNVCATRVCRECEVYRSSGDCGMIKGLIVQATNNSNGKA